ncbi:MAG: ADP-ribosylglycohydrolase family protein [Chlorobiaceae bacterium]
MKLDNEEIKDRAEGCLLGQLAGDALGSLVEFQHPDEIKSQYPDGVRHMADGGTWNTIAGQPTDDSEMALLLARSLADHGSYDAEVMRNEYRWWVESNPFDIGNTIYLAYLGNPSTTSQANGAMMRISPLGIYGAKHNLQQVGQWAIEDAKLTHPHPVCTQANALYAMAIAHAIRTGPKPKDIYALVVSRLNDMLIEPELKVAVYGAIDGPPEDYLNLQGWVLIAFQNALFQLLHAPNPEEGIVNTIMQGGDTDTNAAICGALLGAVYGRKAIPERWTTTLQNCRPKAGKPNVMHTRPECLWPIDAIDLVNRLL